MVKLPFGNAYNYPFYMYILCIAFCEKGKHFIISKALISPEISNVETKISLITLKIIYHIHLNAPWKKKYTIHTKKLNVEENLHMHQWKPNYLKIFEFSRKKKSCHWKMPQVWFSHTMFKNLRLIIVADQINKQYT